MSKKKIDLNQTNEQKKSLTQQDTQISLSELQKAVKNPKAEVLPNFKLKLEQSKTLTQVVLPEVPNFSNFEEAWQNCKTFCSQKFESDNLKTALNMVKAELNAQTITLHYVHELHKKLLIDGECAEYIVAYLKKGLNYPELTLQAVPIELKAEETPISDRDKFMHLEQQNPHFAQFAQLFGLEIDFTPYNS